MITKIEFENFTAFENVQLSLSPRVNVVIGSNGTGKTHLLKAIYGLGLIADGKYPERSDEGFRSHLRRGNSCGYFRLRTTGWESSPLTGLNRKQGCGW